MAGAGPSHAVGDLFDDRYELLGPLGNGVYGEVWRARDQHRGHVVAVKIMEHTDEDAAWKEATRLTQLESPHILRVNNAALAIDVPYLDTAVAQRGTAESAADQVGMAPARAVRLARGLLRGLELCHQQRLLHRDIKPSNVFLTATDDAQLGDFGVAAVMDSAGTASVHGDPDIRPPEVLKGGRCTVASDVYGAGLTLYAMLTGELPFNFWSDHDFRRHETEVDAGPADIRDVAPNVSTPLAKVVRTAVALNASDRYESAAAFDAALARMPSVRADHEPILPHPGHTRCWRVVRRADGHTISVCVEPLGSKEFAVKVAHLQSGNQIRKHCGVVKARALPVHLRAVFNDLR